MARNKNLVASMESSKKDAVPKSGKKKEEKKIKKSSNEKYIEGHVFQQKVLKRLTYAAKMRRTDLPILHKLNEILEKKIAKHTAQAMAALPAKSKTLQVSHLRSTCSVPLLGFR